MIIKDTVHQQLQIPKSGLRPFNPVSLAEATERVVCRGEKRKYLRFGITPNYEVGVATAYAVGCSLRCVFCWASKTRDNIEETADFFSPEEVFEKLYSLAKQKRRINQIRVSDGEPTIGKQHLLKLIELTERSDIKKFILETNGILFGHDREYVKSLSEFKKIYVRVSFKAGTPEDFTRKTGAIPEAFELPFQAIKNLMDHDISFRVASMSADPRFMSPTERMSLIGKLANIDPAIALNLEEEMTILFPTTMKRLKASGWDYSKANIPFIVRKIPGLGRYLQFSYGSVRSLGCPKVSFKFTLRAIRELIHGI